MRRVLLWMLRALVWTVAGAVMLAASTAVHVQLPIARRVALDLVNGLVSGQIKGELSVNRIDELTLHRIVVHHVTLSDGQGRRVISAREVVIDTDLLTIYRGNEVNIRSAHVTDAFVHLIDDGHGSPTLFSCFDSSNPTPGPSSNPLRVVIHHIEASKVTLYGQLLALSGMRAEDIDAHGFLTIAKTVDVDIHAAHGHLTQPFGFVGNIEQLSGTISTAPQRGVMLSARASRDHEHADTRISYKSAQADSPQILDIVVDAQQLSPDTLRRIGYTWVGPLESELTGHVHLRGPTDELAIDANLQSAGGPAIVRGSISRAHGISVHVQSDSMAVAKLVSTAPDLTLRGSVDLTIPTPGAPPNVRLQIGALRYKGVAVPAVDLDGVLEADRLRIDHARARSAGAQLLARGSVGLDGGADLDVDASFPAIQRDPNLSELLPDAQGALKVHVHLHAPKSGEGKLDLRGRVVLEHLHYGSITAARVTLVGSAHGDPQLPTLKLDVLGEDCSVVAYSLGNAHFTLQGAPGRYTAEGEFQAKGQKTFYFNAKISADRQGFTVQADPIEFSVGPNTWRGAAHDLKVLHGQSVTLGLLRLASRSQRLEAHATIRLHGADEVDAQLQDFDLAALHALLGKDFPLSEGHVDGTVSLHGDVARPELVLQGALREVKLLDIPGIEALYSVNYKDGQLDLDSEADFGERGVLHVGGQGHLDAGELDPIKALREGRYELDVSSTRLDLTLAPALRSRLQSGYLTSELHVTGTLDAPTLKGHVALDEVHNATLLPIAAAADLDYHGGALALTATVKDATGELANAQGSITLPWAELRSDPNALGQALGAGKWDLHGATLERQLDRLPISLPQASALPVAVETNFELVKDHGPTEGTIRVYVKTAEALEFEACHLTVQPKLSGMVVLLNGQTSFSFIARLNDERVGSGMGHIDLPIDPWLRGEQPKDLGRFDVQGRVDIAAIDRIPGLCNQGSGEVHLQWSIADVLTDHPTASIKANGSYLPRVRTMEGRRKLRIDSCGKEPIQLELEAAADSASLQAHGQMSGCQGGPTAISGFVPLHWGKAALTPSVDGQRDAHGQLDFSHAQLRPLLDRIPGVQSFSAIAEGQLLVRGNHERVDYQGRVDLTDGQLYLIATGQELKQVKVALIGNGNWAKLEALEAHADDGSLAAEGGIGFDRYTPARISLALLLKNFPLEREAVEMAWLTGSAALTTEIGTDKAMTAVKVHDMAIRLPDASTRALQPLDPHPDVVLTTDKPKLHPEIPYVFEFFVDGRRSITVHRNDFDAVITSELALSYQEPQFRAGGYVDFGRGTFEVLGKKFEINRGGLQFDGTADLNPEVNLVATYDVRGGDSATVQVSVSGTISDPQIEFTSQSCPGDAAVVLLLTGRCPNADPGAAAGDTRDAQSAFATGLVGGILTLGAQRELSGLAPRLSVERQGAQTRYQAGIEAVPKFMRQFVQRVYIQGALSSGQSASTDSSAANTTSNVTTLDFLIELYFPHNIVGSGRFSPERAWGLDVVWEP